MKKIFLLCVVSIFIFSSCGKNKNQPQISEAIIEEKTEIEKTPAVEIKLEESKEKVDLDLSNMNYNMISSILFKLVVEEEKYLGKKIRIKGQFYSNFDEENNIRHFSVLIYDPTACCQVGLMFIPRKKLSFPEDFPKQLETCTVTGIFSVKDLNGMSYHYLDCEGFE